MKKNTRGDDWYAEWEEMQNHLKDGPVTIIRTAKGVLRLTDKRIYPTVEETEELKALTKKYKMSGWNKRG